MKIAHNQLKHPKKVQRGKFKKIVGKKIVKDEFTTKNKLEMQALRNSNSLQKSMEAWNKEMCGGSTSNEEWSVAKNAAQEKVIRTFSS